MSNRDTTNYSHGDTGSWPADGKDYQGGDYLEANHLDKYVYYLVNKIQDHADEFDRLDSDDDGVVDKADEVEGINASDLMEKSTYDSNEDGVVSNADKVDGYDANELGGGGGGVSLTTFDLASGDAIIVAPFVSPPSGYSINIVRVILAADGGTSEPNGLHVLLRNRTDGTNRTAVSSGWSEPDNTYSFNTDNHVLAVDNGQWAAGTGANQPDVAAMINYEIES